MKHQVNFGFSRNRKIRGWNEGALQAYVTGTTTEHTVKRLLIKMDFCVEREGMAMI
jgi:hypothetical protein